MPQLNGNWCLSKSQETANTNSHGNELTVTIENDILNRADRLVEGGSNRCSDETACIPFAREFRPGKT